MTQLLYNSVINNTITFKVFQIIIIHSYLLKHLFWTIMHRHMKIAHHAHRDKWGIFHKFASKWEYAEPSFTHNPSGCVDSFFRSTKELAYDMYSHA
jgi:hypothetical protein